MLQNGTKSIQNGKILPKNYVIIIINYKKKFVKHFSKRGVRMPQENKSIFSNRQLLKIILPFVVQNILSVTIGMVDSVMVSSRGEDAFAGVSLVNSLDTLLVTVFTALATGASVVLAQAMGKKDRALACNAAKQALYATTTVAAVITATVVIFRVPLLNLLFGEAEESVMKNALSYFGIVALSFPLLAIESSVSSMLRAQGDSVTSLKVSIFMNCLNIVGNAILIYACNLGAMGAALATLISRLVGATVMIIIGRSQKRYIYLEKLLNYRPDKDIIKAILHVGVPNGIESSLFQFGRLMTSSLVSSLSTAAIAANAAALTLANFQYTAGGAIQNTMITVVGRCIGAEEKEQAKRYTRILLGIGYLLIILVCGVLCLFSSPLLAMFNLSAEGFASARALLFYHSAVSAVIWVIAFCLPSAFRAANDVNFTMVVSVASIWLFRVALAYFMAKESVSFFGLFSLKGANLGIMGVWIAMTVDWAVRTIFFAWRFLSGKWLTKYKGIRKK